jgi:hypothetical protein
MYKLIKVISFCFLAFPFTVFGQNYVNTPYSKFLIGDNINNGFSYNRSLGGSSIALRPQNQLNYLNPASYTSQDTLSFIFETGATQRFSEISSSTDKDNSRNSNIEYLVMGFPITRWWKFSVGIVPYSRMQYSYQSLVNINPEVAQIDYTGEGGFNEFYFGSAFKIGENISIGANAGYIFGALNKVNTISIISDTVQTGQTYINDRLSANDFYYKIGLQAYRTFNEKHHFIFGVTFDPKTKITLKKNTVYSRNFYYLADTFKYDNNTTDYLKLPFKLGLGLSYIYNGQLMVTGEYTMQDYSKGAVKGSNEDLAKYGSFRFGSEFIPAPLSGRARASYIKRMHYRLGAHYTNTYLVLSDKQISDYGLSVGLGFPWRNSKKLYTYSNCNITYEYGVRGTTDIGLVKEKYHTITLDISLYDFWFLKHKYD